MEASPESSKSPLSSTIVATERGILRKLGTNEEDYNGLRNRNRKLASDLHEVKERFRRVTQKYVEEKPPWAPHTRPIEAKGSVKVGLPIIKRASEEKRNPHLQELVAEIQRLEKVSEELNEQFKLNCKEYALEFKSNEEHIETIKQLKEQIKELEKTMEAKNEQLAEQVQRNESMAKEMTGMKDDMAGMKNDMAEMNTTITGISTVLAGISTGLAQMPKMDKKLNEIVTIVKDKDRKPGWKKNNTSGSNNAADKSKLPSKLKK